jgi:hypothetical protein
MATRPRFGIGSVVRHPSFGRGRIMSYESDAYVILFGGGETRKVAFSFEDLSQDTPGGEPEVDWVARAVRQVLGDHGWIDVELELGRRWVGGTLRLTPGKEGTQAKEIPLEVFFKKILGVRDRLRVLEQKINAHPTLTPEEKLELDGYITRCYGSLTTFNALFATTEGQFKGQGERDA